MTLAPLLSADLAIRLHAIPAILAFLLGAAQLGLPKGSRLHRIMGWTWVALMTLVAASSFFIHTICSFGGFSLIHLLSIVTLVTLPLAVLHARQHRIAKHAKAMKILFFAALVLAGAFTFTPGRIMYDLAFGTATVRGSCAP
jgi:uncharacterized membrane protein